MIGSGGIRAGLSRPLAAASLLAAVAAVVLWAMALAPAAQAAPCGGAEYEFVGGHGNLWSTKENWAGGNIPTSAHSACIASGLPAVEVNSSSAEAKWVYALSPVVITGSGTLTLPYDNKGLSSFEDRSTFTELTVEAGGHLTTVDAPVKVTGNAVINGTVGGDGLISDDFEYAAEGHTLTGTGTFEANFVGLKGTVSPGTVGTVGTLRFVHRLDSGLPLKWLIDIASAGAFDELHYEGGSEVQLQDAIVEGHLISPYSPKIGASWRFLTTGVGGFCVTCGEATKGFALEPATGGWALKLTEEPPVGPQPPVVEATPLDSQADITLTPTNNGNGTLSQYTLTLEPGAKVIPLYSAGKVRISGLTNCTTYTASATVTTSVSTSGPSAAVKFTPEGAAGCSSGTNTGSGGASGGGSGGGSNGEPTTPVASTPKAVEELKLGCTGAQLVLNDVYIHGNRAVAIGSAAKGLIGKKVKILFNEKGTVATTTVAANGEFKATAPLPPASIREAVSTRYTAEIGKLKSLHLKLTRRLLLEPPRAAGHVVTLTGQVTLPLTKPVAPLIVEQQLECGKTSVVARITPPANGRFHISIKVPAGAKAGIYRLTSSVAANIHATAHGFKTFSLPLPVTIQ